MSSGEGQRRGRGAAAVVTAGVVTVLVWGAMSALWSATSQADGTVQLLTAALLVTSGVMCVRTVASDQFSLAMSAFWVWSLIFLGLAPAYQLAAGQFPWLGRYESATVVRAEIVVLLCHAAVVVGSAVVRRRRRWEGVGRSSSMPVGDRTRRVVQILIAAQVAVSATFVALMGPTDLVSGRSAFQVRLVQVAELPGGGTLYFLATAAAITVPAVAILSRRTGMRIGAGLVLASLVAGFVVTNPFIGTRFLTGSFLVAAVGAALLGRVGARYVPVGITVVMVTLFPSLDVLRGGESKPVGVQALMPSQTLLHFDFDAFEMLLRAVVVHESAAREVIDPVMVVLAPVLRWVPFLADMVRGRASGSLVARATGMGFTNVSMPLWGEGYLLAGALGALLLLGLLGVWLGVASASPGRGSAERAVAVADAPTAALLFIVLRGSLYEVLGYLLFAALVRLVVFRAARGPASGRSIARAGGRLDHGEVGGQGPLVGGRSR